MSKTSRFVENSTSGASVLDIVMPLRAAGKDGAMSIYALTDEQRQNRIESAKDEVEDMISSATSDMDWHDMTDLMYEVAERMIDDLYALSKDINAEEWDQAYARDSLKELEAHIHHLTRVDDEVEADKTDHIYRLIKEERHYEHR